MRITFLLACALMVGCTAIVDPGHYHSRDGSTPGADAGRDAGRDDGGMDDAGMDGGMNDAGMPDGGPNPCDPACAAGETCVDGTCQCGVGPSCSAGQACCDGDCRSLDTTLDCRACGVSCTAGSNATPICTASGCAIDCAPSFADCDSDGSSCETYLLEESSCGSCANACGAGQVCGGDPPSCMDTCPPGTTECNPGSCADTTSDIQHCGSCNSPCTAGSNQAATCTASACVYTCFGGFLDCTAASGCESAAVSYYPDADGDGQGASTGAAVLGCPGAPPAGRVANSNDCDDTNRLVYFGATETCDPFDNDCDGTVNEGIGGMPCSCPGSDLLGVDECDGVTLRCRYPNEQCNGMDDDCDGTADNGFFCPADTTRACTVTGCVSTGTQLCNSTCSAYGACVIPELCNRTDDNCDGFVDEDMLAPGANNPLATRAADPRGDWFGARREAGVVYGVSNGPNYDVMFQLLNGSGAMIGTPVLVTSNAINWDVAADGTHWTVAVTMPAGTSTQVVTYRVQAGTNQVFPGVTIAPATTANNPTFPRVRRMGTGGVAIVWIEMSTTGPSRVRGARLTAPNSASNSATLSGTIFEMGPTSGQTWGDCAIATTSTGAEAFFMRWIFTPATYEIVRVPITSTGFGTALTIISDSQPKSGLDVINSFATNTTGLVMRVEDAAGNSDWIAMALTAAGPSAWRVSHGPLFRADIAISGDDAFGVFAVQGTSAQFHRYRISDGARVGSPVAVFSAQAFDVVGIPSGSPGRYITLNSFGDLSSTPIDCRP